MDPWQEAILGKVIKDFPNVGVGKNYNMRSPDALFLEQRIVKLKQFISAQMATKKSNRDPRAIKSAREAIPRLQKWMEDLEQIHLENIRNKMFSFTIKLADNLTPALTKMIEALQESRTKIPVSIQYDGTGRITSASLADPHILGNGAIGYVMGEYHEDGTETNVWMPLVFRHVKEEVVGSGKFKEQVSGAYPFPCTNFAPRPINNPWPDYLEQLEGLKSPVDKPNRYEAVKKRWERHIGHKHQSSQQETMTLERVDKEEPDTIRLEGFGNRDGYWKMK